MKIKTHVASEYETKKFNFERKTETKTKKTRRQKKNLIPTKKNFDRIKTFEVSLEWKKNLTDNFKKRNNKKKFEKKKWRKILKFF